MIAALLVSVAMAGEPPAPCTYYEITDSVGGTIRRDSIDEFFCRVYIVDPKGDTLLRINEYHNTTPEAYWLGHKIDQANAQVRQLDSLAAQLRAKDKKK